MDEIFEREIVTTDREIEKPSEVIDKTKEQETITNKPDKKSNKVLIWGLVIVVIVLIIVGLIYYFKLREKRNALNK